MYFREVNRGEEELASSKAAMEAERERHMRAMRRKALLAKRNWRKSGGMER